MSNYLISNRWMLFANSLIFLFLLNFLPMKGQFESKYSMSLGINTTAIIGDNPASKKMFDRESDVFGGGFLGAQLGVSFRVFTSLDEDENFILPIGIDYNFYRGVERYPISKFISVKRHHKTDIPTFVAGLNYNFIRWPLASAKGYIGIEARGALISQGRIDDTEEYFLFDSTYTRAADTKEAAFRLGCAIRLGIEGQLHKKFFVNFSGAVGVVNLIGRDDSRGELLTPFRKVPFYEEGKESLVFIFQYAFTIQYKL